ncbi:hypothetical protein LTR24_004243 [Lithohypha guttulata]|uniref:Cytochrome P450 n=1 Tax=Lithohypha guttulata TaxID=1690604 RepID=A0ABR0KD10_9EURO|nr:hypothetical protein LTR24_004243 [Lithohypha guttulata]
MLATLVVVSCVLVTCAYLLLPARQQLPPGSQLPGGPSGRPILGNLFDIPPYHSWFKFQEWSNQYGPLFCLNIAGRNHVIVSTEAIANDLLRERGNIYSDREQLPMAAQLLSDNLRPLFLPYGETWRNVRKLMHNLANVSVAASYESLQEEESLRAIRDLVREPGSYETWFERYSGGLILRLAYSKSVSTGKEPLIQRILAVLHNVERVASPGAYLVDSVPALLRLPPVLAPFRREAARLHSEELDLFRTLLKEGVETSQERSQSDDNFCGKWFSNKDSYNISDDQAAYAIGTLFEAGAGTTASAMMSFTLAMTLHPSEFAKLQHEVDSVVGNGRIPSFSDMPNLPRVRAIAKEVLRWRPVTAGGLPHMLTKDDVYKMDDGRSVFLSAGSNVHPVQWTIHREPLRYPDPDSFRPERWLEKEWPTYREPLTHYPNLQNFSAFGFGRRICPGLNIAERSLYILIARIAWCCDIFQRQSSNGEALVPPSYDYTTGFNVQPKPFAFDLTARPDRREILEAQYEENWVRNEETKQNT